MEKLQSAIAKARAARAGQRQAERHGTPVTEKVPAPVVPAVQGARSRAAWDALPECRLAPEILESSRLVAYGSGPAAAPFDVMRTRFLQQMRAKGWRRIAITSPHASCGKSTISTNLAFSLARQEDQQVILAEVDLRKPSLARMLGIDAPKQSFRHVLEGTGTFADNAIRVAPNLAVATTRTGTRNSAEILQSVRAAKAVAEIEALYDPTVMIFDMPPMLIGDDVMAFAGCVDCVLLVAAAESSTIAEIDLCERDLAEQTEVLGIVLNKCHFTEQNYGYYY